jgi:hypothetical protein
MPQVTTFDSPSSPTLPRLRRRPGFWLSVTLLAAILLAGSSALVATGFLAEGQLTTEDGRRLHLVIDARTNTIIGAKLVESQASPSR